MLDLQLSDEVRIICADCAEVLPLACDAVITDPPYGVGEDHGKGLSPGRGSERQRLAKYRREYETSWDARPSPEVMAKVFRTAPLHVIWGGQYFPDVLPISYKWLVWDKGNVMPSYSDAELAWTSATGKTLKIFRYCNNGIRSKEKGRVHPTQKPVALMVWCMDMVKVPEGATVLDPFAGSGSTGVACIRTGRKFIGIEKTEHYFGVARKRLETELSQLRLEI